MKTDTVEDISFLLYFMPVVMYIISTILYVTVSGLTFQESFLSVTRNPYWLVLSLLAVSASLIFHIRSSNEDERTGLISIHAKRMRIIGIIIISLSLGEAIAVSDAQTNAIGLFITGRLPILQSAFIQIPFAVKTENNKFIISVFSSVLILASPILYYLTNMIGLPFVVNLSVSLVLVIFGALLFTRN